ncbi:MAG: molybdate ABC transporter substrate-binding protein [Lachnospiraceae bacterium]|nr:molybdate ABC transporter substrate-binding protein [Lachnospiraceae bacterium]
MKKKLVTIMLVCAMALSLTACGAKTEDVSKETENTGETGDESEGADETDAAKDEAEAQEPVELIIFAVASMTETLTEIGELYEAANPNVTLVFNFDSSGTLKTQIQEGADCDLFISAGQKQMNQLDITADPEVNTEGLDYVKEDSRIDILENKVTLCVTQDNEAGIEDFDDWAAALQEGSILMAMGNSDVPVGQYTQKILAYYDLDEAELASNGVISYGSNVKEVTTQISESSVDCGVIYCTDAYSAGLNIADYATAEMCGQVIYPAAVLKTGGNPEAAQEFLNFLLTDECMEIFEEVGFSRVP